MTEKANVVEKKTGMQAGSQMRITPEEMELIRKTFGGNEAVLRLMRKIFLPEIDPKAPIGQVVDLWMTLDIKDMSPEDVYVNLKARNTLITHVDQQLMSLKLISETPAPTDGELNAKAGKNSLK